MKFLIGVIFMVSLLSIHSFSFAEMQINTQEDEIIVTISPKNPQPYEDVSISISSYATDLNKATISWQMNSKVVLSGIGKTDYSFKALGPNTTTNFDIMIKPVGAMSTITKSVSISPSEIELLWESLDGYVPPFYKGKALPSRGGIIKAVAIPNTDTIKSGGGNVSYSWKNNDNAVTDASGYNKNSFVFSNDLFDTENMITVVASSVGENYTAERTTTVSSYSPKVIFYKKSPTEGTLYNNALNSDTIFTGDEMTMVAVPYFLAIKGSEDNFNYNWNINGDPISTPFKKTELTIRPTARGGYADINVTFENISKLFQKVTGQLKLTL
ncbi:MAG: hypothetical protein WCW54_01640 [Candidatus Paceibacterota bacterium]